MLHSIVGLMNSGKTLYMTYLLYKDFLAGKSIFTNYDVNFTHNKINRDFLFYLGQKNYTFDNISMGLDELWILLDSRKSMENTTSTYFFNQSSKDDSRIYFTSQHNKQNDSRLRDNLHKISVCNRCILINGKFKLIDSEERFLDKKYIDILYIQITEYKRINYYGTSDLIASKRHYLKAKPLFNLFNTRQKIRR